MRWKPIPELLLDDIFRFWQYVQRRGPDDCWNWVGYKLKDRNYGHFGLKGSNFLAHRISYYLHIRIDPKEQLVCHSCNNESCVNPSHLYLGTQAVNMQQMFADKRKDHQGEKHPGAKLSEDEVLDIKALLKTTPRTKLAIMFGVSRSTIDDIATNKTWSYLLNEGEGH
jgi:hypothetical protein